jgi:hypothetical protein
MKASLRIKNIQYNPAVKIDPVVKSSIEQVIAWEMTPGAFHQGRSGHCLLTKPASAYGREIDSLKLKGIGVFDGKDLKEPPSIEPYKDPVPIYHKTVSPKGEMGIVWQRQRPRGGMFASGAEREFNITLDLLDKGGTVNVPVCWGTYEDLEFNDEPLGFVVFGLRDPYDRRISDLARYNVLEPYNANAYNRYFYDLLFTSKYSGRGGKTTFNQDDILGYLNDVYFWYGSAMRHLRESGYLRFAAYSANGFVDPATHKTGLCDFDSTISRDEIDPKQLFMSLLFDVVSAVRGIHEVYCMSLIGVFLIRSDESGIYNSFLKGYFGDSVEKSFFGRSKFPFLVKLLFEMTEESFKYILEGEENRYPLVRNFIEIDMIRLLFPFMKIALKKEGIKPPYGEKRLNAELTKLNETVRELSIMPQEEVEALARGNQ